jgi:hypothetical protein
MEKENINILCQVVIAFSTWVGIGAAIAFYLTQFQHSEPTTIVLIELLYIAATIITLLLIKGGIKEE